MYKGSYWVSFFSSARNHQKQKFGEKKLVFNQIRCCKIEKKKQQPPQTSDITIGEMLRYNE